MRKVCFLPYNATSWREMLALAKLVAASGRGQPVVLLSGQRREALFGPDCRAAGLACVVVGQDAPAPLAGGPGWEQWRARLLRSRWCPGGLGLRAQVRQEKTVLRRQMAEAEAALTAMAPSSAVVYSGRVPDWEIPLLACCRRLGIPSLIPPTAFIPGRATLARRRSEPPHLAAGHPKLLAAYPRQASFSDRLEQEVFFYPAARLAALGELGLLPPDPWVPGANNVDLVLTESQEARDRYVSEGADPAKVVVTGHREHDHLHGLLTRARQDERTQGRSEGRRLLLAALPQLGEQGTLPWDQHWQEIRFLCQVMAETNHPCLLSLHPKMDPQQYAFIEREYGLPLATEPLSHHMPRASVFMANMSSTVLWAVLCRVPAVVYDFYSLGYDFGRVMEAMVFVDDKKDLAPSLGRVLTDGAFHAELVARQDRWAPYLSPFDGKCEERILARLLGE